MSATRKQLAAKARNLEQQVAATALDTRKTLNARVKAAEAQVKTLEVKVKQQADDSARLALRITELEEQLA